MVDYKCGHTHNGTIIMNNNIVGMACYNDWISSTGFDGDKSECFDCYLKHQRKVDFRGVMMKQEIIDFIQEKCFEGKTGVIIIPKEVYDKVKPFYPKLEKIELKVNIIDMYNT